MSEIVRLWRGGDLIRDMTRVSACDQHGVKRSSTLKLKMKIIVN